jgi:hypothetical protein
MRVFPSSSLHGVSVGPTSMACLASFVANILWDLDAETGRLPQHKERTCGPGDVQWLAQNAHRGLEDHDLFARIHAEMRPAVSASKSEHGGSHGSQ